MPLPSPWSAVSCRFIFPHDCRCHRRSAIYGRFISTHECHSPGLADRRHFISPHECCCHRLRLGQQLTVVSSLPMTFDVNSLTLVNNLLSFDLSPWLLFSSPLSWSVVNCRFIFPHDCRCHHLRLSHNRFQWKNSFLCLRHGSRLPSVSWQNARCKQPWCWKKQTMLIRPMMRLLWDVYG